MATIRKYLLYKYAPVMKKIYLRGTRESCVSQRSMFVIPRVNEETRRYINQVRSVATHLSFCPHIATVKIHGT